MSLYATCPDCGGSGHVAHYKACPTCFLCEHHGCGHVALDRDAAAKRMLPTLRSITQGQNWDEEDLRVHADELLAAAERREA